MVSRVSTAGNIVQDMRNMRNNSANFDKINARIATGKKFQELRDYGARTNRLVDLRQEISSRNAYVRSINLTDIFTRAYHTSLTNLSEIAQTLTKATETVLSTQGTSWTDDNLVLADGLLMSSETNLNIEVGGRFLYAGSNYTTAPVNNLRKLEIYPTTGIGQKDQVETFSQVPEIHLPEVIADPRAVPPVIGKPESYQSYHSSFEGQNTHDSNAWQEATLTISDGQTIEYGITATNKSFQYLIDGLMRFKSATAPGLSEEQREDFILEAQKLARTAQDSIRHLSAANGIVAKTIENAKKMHTNFVNISTTAMNDIEVADSEAAATRLSALRAQINASYSVISTRHKLSLVNFI